MKKSFFSLMVFLLITGTVTVFASGSSPDDREQTTNVKVSQLVNDDDAHGGLIYVAVLENGKVTAFFHLPDPPGDPDDAFFRSVLKAAYDGDTSSPAWFKADKSIYSRSKPWYQYDGKTYKRL